MLIPVSDESMMRVMKLSERMSKLEESATLAVADRANALRAKGVDVVAFTTGEPDFDTPQHIKDAAVAALDKGLTKYTSAGGIAPLKEAIARKLERDNGLTYPPSSILISCGAKHSIYNVLQAVCNDGDEVLIPAPYWTSYPEMAKSAGAVPVIIPSTPERRFKITVDDLRAAITPRSKLLLLNSPCNPTGAVYNRDELAAIAAVAVEKDLLVLSDEIYEKLVYGGARHISIAALGREIFERTVVVNGVSKAYAMTGWRIGYAAGPREIIECAARLQSQSTSCPTSISQYASLTALNGPQDFIGRMVAEFQRRRDRALELLRAIDGIVCDRADGAFYLFPDISSFYGRCLNGTAIGDSTSFATALADDQGVVVVPGEAFGAGNHARISYTTSSETIDKGIRRIAAFIGKLRS